MRRTVALLAVGLVLSACSSTVEGRGRISATAGAPASASSAAPPAAAGGSSSSASTDATPSVAGPTDTDTTAPDTTGADQPGTDPTTTDSATATPTTATPSSTPPSEPPPPAGFYAAEGGNLAYRPMSTDEFDCTPDQVSGCFGIMVFSEPGCAAGASVTVGIFDKAVDPDTAIGTASGTTAPILPGGSQGVVIGDSTGVAANLTARVQQVVC